MNPSRCLIITTIFRPNKVLSEYAEECLRRGIDFIIVGDRKSPPDFSLPGSDFWSIERQANSGFLSAGIIPENHYARKNIGYLASVEKGHDIILETDDDNIPYENFWNPSERKIKGRMVQDSGWINIYRLFTDDIIWPRGFPLEHLGMDKNYSVGPEELYECPIQQGLADDNPDVDAVYRLTRELPVVFEKDLTFTLGKGSWSPFNSQNTVWFKNAFPLLYLPSKCSFRMTDIWRSFVAQRISWEYGWKIAFHSPTVYQERNEHSLLRDFEEEVPGYLNNASIGKALESLKLSDRKENIFDNLLRCYELMISMDLVGGEEMDILKLWTRDLQRLI
jgi:hypothetical protein